MKGFLCTGMLALGFSMVAAAEFTVADNSPVVAGERFELRVATGGDGTGMRCMFNGETMFIHGGIKVLKGFEHSPGNAVVGDDADATFGRSVGNGGRKYQLLFNGVLPSDARTRHIWVRAKGGGLCLRKYSDGKSSELKWNWTSGKEYSWRGFGAYSPEELGGRLMLMSEGKDGVTAVDTVILADNANFKPEGKISGEALFSWVTDASAVGVHELPLTLEVDGAKTVKMIKIEVLPRKTTVKSEILPEAGTVEFIPLGDSAVPVKDLADFNFIDKGYREFFSRRVMGIKFPVGDKFLALNCKKYPDLPSLARIEVKRKAAGLLFLHTEYWQGEVGQRVGYYKVHYSDGGSEEIPLLEEVNISGSARLRETPEALFVFAAASSLIDFNILLFPWRNPHPDKEISHIVFANAIVRTFNEENTTVPLNVSSMSSQILLQLGLVADAGLVTALLERTAVGRKELSGEVAGVTVNFGKREGDINPFVFSTNETGIMNSDSEEFQRYLPLMSRIGCLNFRLHSGWSLEAVYPEGLNGPRAYEKLDAGIRALLKGHPERRIMICINKIPKYIDPLKAADREAFAALCVDLARHFKAEGIPVEYWEIFNEVYFRGVTEDRSLWKMYNLAAAGLRKVDGKFKIGGYAPCFPTIKGIADFVKHCGDNIDFVSWHKYPTGSTKTSDEYLMDSTVTFGHDVRRIREVVNKQLPGKKVELALTEYNMNYNWKPHDPRQADYKGACWLASVLYHLIKADLDIAQTWHSRGGGTFGLISRDGVEIRPAAQVLYLGNKYIRGSHVFSMSSDANIECLGFINADNYGMLIVNKSAKTAGLRISLLNEPRRGLDPFGFSTLVYSISAQGYRSGRENLLGFGSFNLSLLPFETRLLLADGK